MEGKIRVVKKLKADVWKQIIFVRKKTKYNKMCVCGNHSVYIKDGRSL